METNTKELKPTKVNERVSRLRDREERIKSIKSLSADAEKLYCSGRPNLEQIISMQMTLIDQYKRMMEGDTDLIFDGLRDEMQVTRENIELSRQFRAMNDKCTKAMIEAETLKDVEKHFYWAYVRVSKLENLLIGEYLDVSELNKILNINNIPLDDEDIDDDDDFDYN